MISYPKELAAEFSFQLDEFYLDLQEDGNRISILGRDKIEERPFPGLRPFKTSEFQLFKGRDGQAEELIKRLKKNHFLAVIGSSGTGKSSLVRAGLIPQLFGGYLHAAGTKWNIAICRPGKDPVENLAIALSAIKGHSKEKNSIYENYQDIGAQLNNSIYGVLDVDEMLNAGKAAAQKSNLLIIIDQFEELFRFDRKDLGKKNIENHFINLLLKASLNPASSVYVIITMRSEFLGDCVKYRGLPEAINEGQYLVPQLTRNQLKEVIEGPISLAGKKIAPGLVELLVNEVEESKLKENLDQLPILQHALMRTYQQAMKRGADTEISYEHYQQVGEMEKALPNRAEAKYHELGEVGSDEQSPSKKQQIAKVVFQALTDASTDQKGGRRPTELRNIYAIAKMVKASEKEVDEVVNHFRDVDTSFIMPPINPNLPDTGLYPGLIIDISHESLMRNWDRLNKWITEEVRFGKLYKTLNERRELNEHDPNELVRGVLLRELLEWERRYSNNVTWASRYHSIKNTRNKRAEDEELFAKNVAFLLRSKRESDLERRKKERGRTALFSVLSAATLISLCFALWAFKERANATKNAGKAKEQEKVARQQATRAAASEKNAREQSYLASIAAKDARRQRDIAVAYAKEAQRLSKERVGALVQRELALVRKHEAERQNEDLRMQLAKGEVQMQPFYSSNYLSPHDKESIVNALFLKPLPETQQIRLDNYINPELLGDVNRAVAARREVLFDPVKGLRRADSVWTHMSLPGEHHQKNLVVQRILQDIFKKNAFPRQEIKPGSFAPSLFSLSKDSTHFVIDNANGIVTGTFDRKKDSIRIENTYSFPATIGLNDRYNAKATINALSYVDGNKVLCVLNNGKLVEWDGKTTEVTAMAGAGDAFITEISPNGRHIVAASPDQGVLRVWTRPDQKTGETIAAYVDSSNSNKYLKKLSFSRDGKRLMKFYYNGRVDSKIDGRVDSRVDIWNVADKKPSAQLSYVKEITAANFSPDGKYIFTASIDNEVMVYDSLGKLLRQFHLADRDNEFFIYRIASISLLPDWRKALIGLENGEVFIAKRFRNDSLVSLTTNSSAKPFYTALTLRKLNGSVVGIKNALFTDTTTIVSLNNYGYIDLWKDEKTFRGLKTEFAAIKDLIALSYIEKLEAGAVDFDQIKKDTDRTNLRTAALYYTNSSYDNNEIITKENASKALMLYDKLSRIDSGSLKIADLNNTLQLLLRLNEVEVDEPKQNAASIVNRLKRVVALSENELRDFRGGGNKRTVANYYNDLAYYSIFDRKFAEAIEYCNKGLLADSSYSIIYTNLALAYLLNKQDAQAESLYRKYKNISFENESYDFKNFKEAFLKDFRDLTAAGVIQKTDKGVKRIIAMLVE